jgi:XapX domain-containing protein
MRLYAASLAAGVLVGTIYALLNVRSPAPPVIALVGLFGILLGEQIVPIAKRLMVKESLDVGWVKTQCVPHIFGQLPSAAMSRSARDKELPTCPPN